MAYFLDSKYRDGSVPFPKHDIDPDKKGEEWHYKFIKAIYSRFCHGDTTNTDSWRQNAIRNRRYAEGRQDTEIYKDFLIGGKQPSPTGTPERKGYANMNFEDIFSPAPKYVSVIQGMFEQAEHSIVVSAEDELSGTEKENQKETMWFETQEKSFMAMMDNKLGIQKPDKFMPQTRQELELYQSMGGFKLRYETAMEKALSHTFKISNWKEIKRKVIFDLICNNMAAVFDYTDKNSGLEKLKYIDFTELMIEYSRDWNFDRSQWAGFIDLYTIEELRTSGCELKEAELESIAHKYSDQFGNPGWGQGSTVKYTDGTYGYNNYRIPVMYAAWKSYSNKYVTERKTNNGRTVKDKTKFGKVWDTENKKTNIVSIQVVHNAKWIVDTEYVFDWGLMYDTPRQGKHVRLPFHVYRVPGKSLIEQMIPSLDSIEMTYLKLQNNKAKAAPPGLIIELGSLENISIGGGKLKPLDVLKIYQQDGTMFYKATPFMSQGYNTGPPIVPHNGTMGGWLTEYINSFETDFNHIAEITGIARNATGTVDADAQVGTSRMAVAATNNVLKPIYAGYIDIKESAATNAALRIQLLVKYNEDDETGYYPVIGRTSVEALKNAGDDPPVKWGIRIEALPTEETRQELKAAAQQALAGGKNGIPALTYNEYLYIVEKLNSSGAYFTEMRAYIGYKEHQRDMQAAATQEENMRLNAENAQKTEMMKAQAEAQKIALQEEEKRKTIQLEQDLKLRNDLYVIQAKAGVNINNMLQEIQSSKPSLSGQPQMPAQPQQEMQIQQNMIQ